MSSRKGLFYLGINVFCKSCYGIRIYLYCFISKHDWVFCWHFNFILLLGADLDGLNELVLIIEDWVACRSRRWRVRLLTYQAGLRAVMTVMG